jgi:hypothetical protein
MEAVDVIYPEVKGLYKIYPSGQIWSNRMRRFLKPYIKPEGYCVVGISNLNNGYFKLKYVHKIIADHFLKPIPVPNPFKYEINHKDLNKTNNNVVNLEWVTHQQNIIHARNNKDWYSSGREPGFTVSDDTKQKMAEKKHKKVFIYNDSERINFDSIQQLVDHLHTYRKAFNRFVDSCKTHKGYYIRYIK